MSSEKGGHGGRCKEWVDVEINTTQRQRQREKWGGLSLCNEFRRSGSEVQLGSRRHQCLSKPSKHNNIIHCRRAVDAASHGPLSCSLSKPCRADSPAQLFHVVALCRAPAHRYRPFGVWIQPQRCPATVLRLQVRLAFTGMASAPPEGFRQPHA